MTTSGVSGKGVNSKKSLGTKAPGAPKDLTQSAKADSSLLSPAVLMALGMAGMAVAAVPEVPQRSGPNLPDYQAAIPAIPEQPEQFVAHAAPVQVVLTQAEWDNWGKSLTDEAYIRSIVAARLGATFIG